MSEKYIMLDMDDERAGAIAEVIGNATCKKILGLIAEKEMSEGDLSGELKIPINTVEYNINKLVAAGLIEETKGFLWSTRGKKIKSYRAVNKKILISPKKSLKGVVPAIVVSVLGAIGIKLYSDSLDAVNSLANSGAVSGGAGSIEKGVATVAPSATSAAGIMAEGGRNAADYATSSGVSGVVSSAAGSLISPWAWFVLGAFVAILIYVLWNMIKSERGFSINGQ